MLIVMLRVAVDPLALMPERGGKKGLKVAKVLLDDPAEDVKSGKKQRMVIVGGGWGVSTAILSSWGHRRKVLAIPSKSDGSRLTARELP
jgi:hypothetical protein